jgi:hypothetical protein
VITLVSDGQAGAAADAGLVSARVEATFHLSDTLDRVGTIGAYRVERGAHLGVEPTFNVCGQLGQSLP